MIKECEVKSNNDYCTVVKYDDTYVQIPSIGRDKKTVFVKYEDDRYIAKTKQFYYLCTKNSDIFVDKYN